MADEYEPSFYVPGSLGVFGAADTAPWGGPDEADPVVRAARVQDQVARSVRTYLRSAGVTQSAFADEVGLSRPKLNRLLRGREWARLPELERMLGGCGETMSAVAWAIGDGHRQPGNVRKVIASYLHEQLSKVEGETAGTEPEHPSTQAPPH